MIAFGSSITAPETYERCAKPGIERAAEPDSEMLACQALGSIPRTYNVILDSASALDDLEALVLVHQDVEIVDRRFCATLREALRDPGVGIVGCMGAIQMRGIGWWEGSVTWASSVYRYGEAGGGEVPMLAFNGERAPAHAATGEVDMLNGCLLALSPWAVCNLRFDEALGPLHGYDFDLCQQVRAAGRKVMTADLRIVHHHSLHLIIDNEPWLAAHVRAAEKWDPFDGDWKQRARRAEAEAGAARLVVASRQYQGDAGEKEYERRLNEITQSVSWRITAPLRRLNAARRTLPGRTGG